MIERPQFKDKQLRCVDCGRLFTFSSGERFYYWAKGLAEPKRCHVYRLKRKITLVKWGSKD